MTPTAKRIFEVAQAAGIKKRSLRSTLGKICGISPQAVRDWEEGATKNIRNEHIVAIAKHFGVSVDYLITGRAQQGSDIPEVQEAARLFLGLPEDEKQLFLRMLRKASETANHDT